MAAPSPTPGDTPFALPAPPAVDNTLGALLVGGVAATALWGVTCAQTFTFFTRPSKDRLWHKALIAFLWVLDTFDTILNCHILYFYLVSNYYAPQTILFPVWSVIIHVAATSISNFIIRGAFARRVYRLSNGNKPGTTWIVVLSTLDLCCGLIITAKAFGISSYLELDNLSTLMYLNFAAGTGSDLSVALALCYLLRRSRTGFKRTDSLIHTLMTYTVNTGAIVALDASAGLLCYIVMPHKFIFLGFYLLLSKLYLNSYLAILNARNNLRDQIDDGPTSVRLSAMRWRHDTEDDSTVSGDKRSRAEQAYSAPNMLRVDVEVSSSTKTDADTMMDTPVEKTVPEYYLPPLSV